jgi:hypothetical protein
MRTQTEDDHTPELDHGINTLTHWGRPGEMLDSGYGNVSYRDWCDKELARMHKHGDNTVRLLIHPNGSIALSRYTLEDINEDRKSRRSKNVQRAAL